MEESKFKEILNNIIKNFPYRDDYERISQRFQEKSQAFQTKADEYLSGKCQEPLVWLSNNSVSLTQLEPKEGVDKEAFQVNLEKFKQCVQANDLGVIDILNSFDKEYEELQRVMHDGIKVCASINSTEVEMKNCLSSVVEKGIYNTVKVYTKYMNIYEEKQSHML